MGKRRHTIALPPRPSCNCLFSLQAKLRQKRRKETRLELERVRALEEKAEVICHTIRVRRIERRVLFVHYARVPSPRLTWFVIDAASRLRTPSLAASSLRPAGCFKESDHATELTGTDRF